MASSKKVRSLFNTSCLACHAGDFGSRGRSQRQTRNAHQLQHKRRILGTVALLSLVQLQLLLPGLVSGMRHVSFTTISTHDGGRSKMFCLNLSIIIVTLSVAFAQGVGAGSGRQGEQRWNTAEVRRYARNTNSIHHHLEGGGV